LDVVVGEPTPFELFVVAYNPSLLMYEMYFIFYFFQEKKRKEKKDHVDLLLRTIDSFEDAL
jgi:hypothetical protein